MEETDAAKEWFVTHEGKQFGPVSMDDLRFEVERGELNPRLDMVWKTGMEEWIPAGELDGLFEKNDEAKAAEKAKEEAKNFTAYVSGDTPEDIERAKGNWPGVGRGMFFFMVFIFPLLFAVGIGAAKILVKDSLEPALLDMISGGLLLLPVLFLIAFTLKRFQNLGMTRWWFFGQFVPVLSFWVQYRLFACPPGYAHHKKLDGLGWFLAILYWLLTLAVAAVIGYSAYLFTTDPDKLQELMTANEMQELGEFWEKARVRGEQITTPAE